MAIYDWHLKHNGSRPHLDLRLAPHKVGPRGGLCHRHVCALAVIALMELPAAVHQRQRGFASGCQDPRAPGDGSERQLHTKHGNDFS
eukprot:scaffold289277_cov36-Prasinocladus_malaysianus.AAC.1